MPNFRIQYRKDTTANWESVNPILLDGEVGYEKTAEDLILMKVGDGVRGADGTITGTHWNDLPYVSGPQGPKGDMPQHEWFATTLRFQNPDGTWGEYVDLRGPKGDRGAIGPEGPTGVTRPATKITLGGIIVGENLEITADGCLSAKSGMPCGSISAFYGSFGGSDGRRPIDYKTWKANESWVLCDGGTSIPGYKTPDLRNRFIKGSSGTSVGATGGTIYHNHPIAGAILPTTLTINQMPSHGHAAKLFAGTREYFDYLNEIQPFGAGRYQYEERESMPTFSIGGSQPHTHGINLSLNATDARPPYYELAYIMKIA